MIADVAGTSIYYNISGQGDKRIVLLHGWGCTSDLMQPIADSLSNSMSVLQLDFPGHGRSGRPPQPWGVPEYAAAVHELLCKLNFLPCDVIAHSFGGRIVIWLASTYDSIFQHIVLTGAAGIKKTQSEESRKRTNKYQRQKHLLSSLRTIKVLNPLLDRAEQKLRQKYGSADYNALDDEMRKTFVKVIQLDLSDKLCRIKQPTLLVWGDHDTETPLWMGQRMEHDIPDAGLIVFENGTHFAYLEQSSRLCIIVKSFLGVE